MSLGFSTTGKSSGQRNLYFFCVFVVLEKITCCPEAVERTSVYSWCSISDDWNELVSQTFHGIKHKLCLIVSISMYIKL